MTAAKPYPQHIRRIQVWLLWTVVTLAGYLVASVPVGWVLSIAGPSPIVPWVWAGAIQGLCIGLGQWLVLRRYLPSSWAAWLLATMVGFSVYLVALAQLPTAAFLGPTVGLAQWLILRGKLSRAGWWIVAYLLAGTVVNATGQLWMGSPFIASLVISGITGFALSSLLEPPPTAVAVGKSPQSAS